MSRANFLAFMDALDALLPFEASNSLAHVVFEDGNYDDDAIQSAIQWIDDKKYLDSTGAEFLRSNPAYIDFVSGILNMMLLIPEDMRVVDEHDYD